MPDLDRRRLLRYGAAVAIVSATAGGAQTLAVPGSAAQAPPPDKDPRDFDTEYRGKKIKGLHDKKTKKHKVSINGKKLAVMEIKVPAADGKPGAAIAVISALTHFEPFLLDEDGDGDGLLRMTKKAVDTLGDDELTDLAGEEHDHGR
jgi:hypothetical protein